MNISDISKQIKKGHITMVEGTRGSGPETLFIIKDDFNQKTLGTNCNFVEFLSCTFEIMGIKPITILIKLDEIDSQIYSLCINICEKSHQDLLKNLSLQDTVTFALVDPNDKIVKLFEINNSIKSNYSVLLNNQPLKTWDKTLFFEAVNSIHEKYDTHEKLWLLMSAPTKDSKITLYQ